MTDSEKHSSLLQYEMNCEYKKCYSTGSRIFLHIDIWSKKVIAFATGYFVTLVYRLPIRQELTQEETPYMY